jgi:ferredoxin-NADP reductase
LTQPCPPLDLAEFSACCNAPICSKQAGRRYTLVAAHQRLSLSAALAVKLERDGHIRPLCRVSGKTLWVSKPVGADANVRHARGLR